MTIWIVLLLALLGVFGIVAAAAAWLGKWRSWDRVDSALFGSPITLLPYGLVALLIVGAYLTRSPWFGYGVAVMGVIGLVLGTWRPHWSYPPWYRAKQGWR